MALNKTTVAVRFGQGVDTKSDAKTLAAGKLLLLENGVIPKRGRIDKRNGYAALSNQSNSGLGSVLPGAVGLGTFKDELVQYANGLLYAYSPTTQLWVNKGPLVSALVSARQVIKNAASQTQADSAVLGSIGLYGWEDSRGGVWSTVVDEASGSTLVAPTQLNSSASRVRCVASGSYLYIFYYISGALYVQQLNPKAPTSFGSAVTIASNVNSSNPTYDVMDYLGQRIVVGYNVQGSSQVCMLWLDSSPSVLTGAYAPVSLSGAATNALGLVLGPSNNIYVAWANQTDGLRGCILTGGLQVAHSTVTLDSYTTTAIVNVTGYTVGTSFVEWLYEKAAASGSNLDQMIGQASLNANGTTGSTYQFLRSVGLASKPFTYTDRFGSTATYVCVVHDSPLQATYFTVRSDGVIVAKHQYTQAGGLTTRPILANVSSLSNGVFSWAILKKGSLETQNGQVLTPTGVCRASVDLSASQNLSAAELGGNLHVAGGVLWMYDGQAVTEHGFHLYPEQTNASWIASGPGNLAAGIYSYVYLYEWTDANGQLHRSAPSVPFSVTITAGNTANVNATIPTLRLTQKNGSNTTAVNLVVYRTQGSSNGTTYYRVTPFSAPLYNSTTADSVSFFDNYSDSTISSNEILYTTGGILQNDPAPAARCVKVYKNRLFLAGLEDETAVVWSKEYKKELGVAFSADFKKALETVGGDVTSLAVLDDKLIAFKKDRFYFTYGDGTDDLGNGDFAEWLFITADAGCVNPSSVVRAPQGIAFQSAKGLYLLDNQLGTSYFGADIERWNSETITGAVLVAEQNQIRFSTSTGPLLVYDYYQSQWYTWQNLQSYAATMWGSTYVLARTSGRVWTETPGSYTDAGAPIPLRIGTGWLALIETGWPTLGGIVGYQRIYRFMLLGDYQSSHRLNVRLYYDYSDANSDSMQFTPDSALPMTKYGDEATFGSETPYGGADNQAYRFVGSPRIQKCQAIRFLIEEDVTAATAGTQQGFSLTALGLVVGTKGGTARLKSSLSIGTE